MTPNDNVWRFDPPSESGWYAVTVCWDVQEGVFPDANYWDGAKWQERTPVGGRSPSTFADKDAALAWARAHDPEGL